MIATPTIDQRNDLEASAQARLHLPMRRPEQPQGIATAAPVLASDQGSERSGSAYFAAGGLLQCIAGAVALR